MTLCTLQEKAERTLMEKLSEMGFHLDGVPDMVEVFQVLAEVRTAGRLYKFEILDVYIIVRF